MTTSASLPARLLVFGGIAMVVGGTVYASWRRPEGPAKALRPIRRKHGLMRLLYYMDPLERLQLGLGLWFSAGYSWSTASLAQGMEGLLHPSQLQQDIGELTVRFLRQTLVAELFNLGYILCIKWVAHRLVARLRSETFRAMLRKDAAYFDTRQTGGLLTVLLEGAGKAVDFPESAARIVNHSVFIFRGVAVLVRLRSSGRSRLGPLALELCAIIAGSTLFVVFMRPYTRAQGQSLEDRQVAAGGFAAERLGAVRTVQAFNMQGAEAKAYSRWLQAVYHLEAFRVTINAFQQVFLHGVAYLGAARILLTCGAAVAEGTLTVGGLVTFSARTLLMVVGARGLLDVSRRLGDTVASTAPLFELLDDVAPQEPQATARLTSVRGALEFRAVDFRYPARPGSTILSGLSLNIPAGTKVAVVGPSGCGKTTLALLALKLYCPSRGQVFLDGHDVETLDTEWLRGQIGYVPQDPVLFQGTVEENIRYGTEATKEEVVEAARQASADTFIQSLPQHYDTVIGQAGCTLSGGQRQRIAIARALVRRPRILLLDEATSSLDSENEAQVQAAIDAIVAQNNVGKEPMTVVMVGHRYSSLAIADLVVVLSGGRVVAHGSFKELAAEANGVLPSLLYGPAGGA